MIPERTISAMYAAAFRLSPSTAAVSGEMIVFIETLAPNRETWGTNRAMLYQKMSCTSSGVPRKNQTYVALTDRRIRLREIRIEARITARPMPRLIQMNVNSMVTVTPCMIWPLAR